MPDDKTQPKSPQVPNPQAPIGPSKPAIHDAADAGDSPRPSPSPAPAPDRPDPSRHDVTRPGGAYINTRKVVVDAEGQPIEGLTVSRDGRIVEGPNKAKDE